MNIANYLSDEKLKIYIQNQNNQLEIALSKLEGSWEHGHLVERLLQDTKKEMLKLSNCDESSSVYDPLYERKIEKYTSWIEVLRLIKYQYGRYSDLHKSYSEGLYSTLCMLCATYLQNSRKKEIAVVGCGPGRTVADIAIMYPHCMVYGLDYSLLSLVVAKKILGDSDGDFYIPYRDTNNESSITSIMSIRSLGLHNVRLGLFDLMDVNSNQYDLIVCSNTVNLMPDHKIAVANLASMLNENGIIIFADLVGWRMDRSVSQTKMHSMKAIITLFEENEFDTLDYFKGGPYVEDETEDTKTEYMEYFYVGRKRGIV